MSALKDSDLARIGVDVAHFFGGGAYIKETRIPQGTALTQHAHAHDHLSYLVRGTVRVEAGGGSVTLNGPCCLTLFAHEMHAVHALTDAVWLCVWATDCEDAAEVDKAIEAGT